VRKTTITIYINIYIIKKIIQELMCQLKREIIEVGSVLGNDQIYLQLIKNFLHMVVQIAIIIMYGHHKIPQHTWI